MRLNKLFLSVLFFISSTALARTEVVDPQNLLQKVRDFVGVRPFAETFRCGDHAAYSAHVISCEEVKCEGDGCWQACTTVSDPKGALVDRSVVNCTDDSAQIFIDLSGDMEDLLKSEFDAAGGTAPDLFMATLDRRTTYLNASLFIQSVQPAQYTLARGTKNERKIEALNITAEFGEKATSRFTVIMTVVKDAKGVGQMARLRIGDQTWFLLQDLP